MKALHYRITEPGRVRDILVMVYQAAVTMSLGGVLEITLRLARSKRSLEQNAAMWAMLADIANQVQWVVDGRQTYLEPEEWKDILTAGLAGELRVAQGINGGIVLLGRRTSKMTTKQMGELLELMQAFAAERGVRFSAPRHQVEQWSAAA